MGKRGARFYPPAEKPTLPNKNEVGFTSNATNRDYILELYGPPKGMHMKGEIIFIVLSSRVVCISLVVCETGMSTRLWMVDSVAAGSIFGVGIIAGVAAIAGLAVYDTTMVNSALAGSTVVLVDTSAAIDNHYRQEPKYPSTNEEKWKLPVENIVLRNEDDYSVGNPAITRCTETDSVNSQISLEVYENDLMDTDSVISQTSLEIYENDIMETEDGILSEFQIDSSFGNSATLDFQSSDVSTKIGFTKQKICQHILFESTQQEDGSHLNGCSSGYMSVNASCNDLDKITISSSTNQNTLAEFPREETFGQDVNSHSSGHLSVTGDESSKQSEEGILSEFQNERSFGNSATLNLPSSDVSKEIGYTKQKICQKILLESTQQEDGTHLNGFSSGYMSEIASCKDRDQITCAEFPREETFGQDVNSHSSGHLSVTGNESSKDNEEGILSELQIKRSFGNSASFDLPISDVSKKIGYTNQKICQKILLESTQLEDGTHLNGCSSGYMSVNSRCKDRAGSKRLDWYSQQSDGNHPDSRVNENKEALCSRETIKCQLDRVEEWLKSNDFERMNTDIDDYTGCGEHEFKPFENSITQCNKECKCEKISKDKAITDISCLRRSCSNIKAKSLNKDNDSSQLDSFPDAQPLHDRSKANFHEHYFETHAKIKGNFQTNPLHCISITPKTESMLYPQDSQRDSNETKTIASSSRKSNSLQNISNNESKHKIKNFPFGNKSCSSYITRSFSPRRARRGLGTGQNMVGA